MVNGLDKNNTNISFILETQIYNKINKHPLFSNKFNFYTFRILT